MGPYVSWTFQKCYSFKPQPKVFKLLLNLLLSNPCKSTFGIFEIMTIKILAIVFLIFGNMGPYGNENFKIPKRTFARITQK